GCDRSATADLADRVLASLRTRPYRDRRRRPVVPLPRHQCGASTFAQSQHPGLTDRRRRPTTAFCERSRPDRRDADERNADDSAPQNARDAQVAFPDRDRPDAVPLGADSGTVPAWALGLANFECGAWRGSTERGGNLSDSDRWPRRLLLPGRDRF